MPRIKFQVPPQQIGAFQVDVKAREIVNHKLSQLVMSDVDKPYVTTNDSSPVIFMCNVDESFFEMFNGRRSCVIFD